MHFKCHTNAVRILLKRLPNTLLKMYYECILCNTNVPSISRMLPEWLLSASEKNLTAPFAYLGNMKQNIVQFSLLYSTLFTKMVAETNKT